MVTAEIEAGADGFEFRCVGHAADGRVCAAVSMLEQAVTQAAYWEQNCMVRYGPDETEKLSGEFWASVRYGDYAYRARMEGMLAVLTAGFELLQYRYPDQVQLKKRGENAGKS